MAFFDKYPYTDFHELNLDWLIEQMKNLETQVDNLHDTLYQELTTELKEYVNNQIEVLANEFVNLQKEFNSLGDEFTALSDTFDAYKIEIDGKIDAINARITAEIQGVNDRTDILIASNNEYLLDQMQIELRQLTVINFFTGEQVPIQDMFNYLAGLHLTDSIDYNTMALRAKTYTQLVGLNINYTNLAMHGNTLYV